MEDGEGVGGEGTRGDAEAAMKRAKSVRNWIYLGNLLLALDLCS